MYRVAICDDNAEEGKLLHALTEQSMAERNIDARICRFLSPAELLSDMQANNSGYDLFLLDILMGKTNGIELAQALRSNGSRAMLIYTTSSRDYAIEGYKVQANDYLLKPIEKDALDAAIGRILARRDTILVESGGVLKSVLVADILFVEAAGNYVLLHIAGNGGAARIRATLQEIGQKLGADRFARCHKGYLVNLAQIREIGPTDILLQSGETVPLGRQYRNELQKDMVQYVEKATPL